MWCRFVSSFCRISKALPISVSQVLGGRDGHGGYTRSCQCFTQEALASFSGCHENEIRYEGGYFKTVTRGGIRGFSWIFLADTVSSDSAHKKKK